jgi:hypothetical protein
MRADIGGECVVRATAVADHIAALRPLFDVDDPDREGR